MFEAMKQRRAMRHWMKSEIGIALQQAGHEFFWNDGPFSYLDEAQKIKHCQELHGKALAIYASESPMLAVREQLAEYVFLFAQLMVIGIKSDSKDDVESYDTPYISGKLHEHLEDIIPTVDELGRLRFDDPSIEVEEIRSYCTSRASLMLFYTNNLNMVSIAVEDRAARPSEWYKAFIQASMVAAEDDIRRDIGLPSLLSDKHVGGLIYSNFSDDVINGEPDPFFSWTKRWPEHYLLGKGPRPA